METIYNTPAAAAKQIRIELKAAFPGIKFSVRTETYSMGNSINISWTNGPTQKAVNLIVKKYEYGRFDGMTDSSSVEDTLMSMPDGTVARLGGAKHVFTRREISDDIKARAERDVCSLNSVEYKGANTPVMGENGYSRWNAGELSRSIIYARDLTKGYNGMRLLPQTEDRIGFEDCIEIVPEGEVIVAVPEGCRELGRDEVLALGDFCTDGRGIVDPVVGLVGFVVGKCGDDFRAFRPAPAAPVAHVLPVEPVSVILDFFGFARVQRAAIGRIHQYIRVRNRCTVNCFFCLWGFFGLKINSSGKF